MNIFVLDIATLGSGLDFNPITRLGKVKCYDITMPEHVNERITDAEVVIANKVILKKENLVHAKNLKLICVTATGYDNIDIQYCREQGIAVCNVEGYSTDSVAQLLIKTDKLAVVVLVVHGSKQRNTDCHFALVGNVSQVGIGVRTGGFGLSA